MVDTKGERIIINYPSPDLLPDAECRRKLISLSGMLCWQMYAGTTALKKPFTLARQAGVMTVLDGDITPQDISELVALSDHAPFRTGSGALNGRERDGQCAKTNRHKRSQMVMSM